MGLTKQYLRYVAADNFNVIASLNCNAVFVTIDKQEGRYVATGGCEDIIIWDLRLGDKVHVFKGDKHEVTFLTASPDKRTLAAGYSNGVVQIYDLETHDIVTIFSGHKSAITTLVYDGEGHRLASGSKDTDIILWDVVAEKGLSRLSGHKGVITQLAFLPDRNILASSSKDTFVKFWDLDTNHCFKTLIGHCTEVWALVVVKQGKYIVTGTNDGELRVWHITENNNSTTPATEFKEELESDVGSPILCTKVGSILRTSRKRVAGLVTDNSTNILGCFGIDNMLELFEIRNDEEMREKHRKRLRKERKKSAKEVGEVVATASTEVPETCPSGQEDLPGLRDEVVRLPVIKVDGKIKAASLVLGRGKELRVSMTLSTNAIDLYSLSLLNKSTTANCLRQIRTQGHQSEVRAVAFSSDNLAIISGSGNSLKVWNRSSLRCLRTISTGYILSACFVPGDRHALLGTKDGHLVVVDIASGEVLEQVPAHSKELWSVSLYPDQRGCITGGGDSTVKFWQFELIEDPNSSLKSKVLSVLHSRTLKLEESVLCTKISPNGKYVAVALLDTTVKVFFVDTLKFFLSLYGHKLPVSCLDFSYDSTLIVTGSADRNVKIWGTDFGDCHRSLFAHEDSVTAVQFVPRTHQFFSCGKDGRVKHWDADNFERILTLEAHHGEAWTLSVSPNGDFVVSCGSDRVLRLFERTEEPLVLEDERETEREKEDDEAVEKAEETAVPGQGALNLPSKRTVGSDKAAELLMECLQVGQEYALELQQHAAASKNKDNPPPPPQPPLLMKAFGVTTPSEYLIKVLSRIRSSELEECLLLLPFSSVLQLLPKLTTLLKEPQQPNTELLCRVALFLVRVHHGPIVGSSNLLPVIKRLQVLASERIAELRDLVGFNLHGFLSLQDELEAREGLALFTEAIQNRKQRGKKRRKGPAKQTVISV